MRWLLNAYAAVLKLTGGGASSASSSFVEAVDAGAGVRDGADAESSWLERKMIGGGFQGGGGLQGGFQGGGGLQGGGAPVPGPAPSGGGGGGPPVDLNSLVSGADAYIWGGGQQAQDGPDKLNFVSDSIDAQLLGLHMLDQLRRLAAAGAPAAAGTSAPEPELSASPNALPAYSHEANSDFAVAAML